MSTPFTLARTQALELDAADPLHPLRQEFALPKRQDGSPAVYFCGHSLGLQARRAVAYVNEELEEWQRRGVEAHFSGRRPWVSWHERLTPALARLVGAQPLEVVAMNSLTTNLHLQLVSFYRPTPERFKLLIERPAFPSDRYAVESQVRFHGLDPATALLEIGPRAGEDTIRTNDILALIEREGRNVATVLLPGVQYLTGQRFDIPSITAAAQAQGCVVGFDLAHAIGNIPLQLHDWNVDFAMWCSYKYLNGGPGAVGGCFVHERHARSGLPRFAGWWGHDKSSRFRMPAEFQPLPGAEGWQLSNPPILAMAPLLAALEIFDAAGIERLHAKSGRLTAYFAFLLQGRLAEQLTVITPPERGCQLSFRIEPRCKELHSALAERGFIADFREPDVLRAAPVPLYNSFVEVWEFVSELAARMGVRPDHSDRQYS